MKRYSENCWPSTPPPLEAAMLKLAFSKRVMAWMKKWEMRKICDVAGQCPKLVPASSLTCSNRWEGSGLRDEGPDSKPHWIGHPSEVLLSLENIPRPNSGRRITWSSHPNLGWRTEPDIPSRAGQSLRKRLLRRSNPSGTSDLDLQYRVNFAPSGCWTRRPNV